MKPVAVLTFAVLTLLSANAEGASYTVEPGEPNEVVFLSKAPMESFEGRTREVSGSFDLDPTNLSGEMRGEFTVDLTSLDTGIGLRNKHMRENHLETEDYPQATLTVGTISEASSGALSETPATFQVAGEFTLHGKTVEVMVSVEAALVDGAIQGTARFPVSLAAHDIKRPKFLMMKLADEQAITVQFTAILEGS